MIKTKILYDIIRSYKTGDRVYATLFKEIPGVGLPSCKGAVIGFDEYIMKRVRDYRLDIKEKETVVLIILEPYISNKLVDVRKEVNRLNKAGFEPI